MDELRLYAPNHLRPLGLKLCGVALVRFLFALYRTSKAHVSNIAHYVFVYVCVCVCVCVCVTTL